MDLIPDNYDEILIITRYLQQNKIKCLKYNNMLDTKYQNQSSQQSYLQLSGDHQTFEITNRKPIVEEKYSLSTDRYIIKGEKDKQAEKRKEFEKWREGKADIIDPLPDLAEQFEQPLVTELDEDLDDVYFKENKSAGSCNIKNI